MAVKLSNDVEEALEFLYCLAYQMTPNADKGTKNPFEEEVAKFYNVIKSKLQAQASKLNAIREVCLDDTKAGTGDEQRVNAYFKIKQILGDE